MHFRRCVSHGAKPLKAANRIEGHLPSDLSKGKHLRSVAKPFSKLRGHETLRS